MEFTDVVKNRYSVRKFTEEKASQKLINGILEIGRLAPSGNNNQPTVVYVLDEEKIAKLGRVSKLRKGNFLRLFRHSCVVFRLAYL